MSLYQKYKTYEQIYGDRADYERRKRALSISITMKGIEISPTHRKNLSKALKLVWKKRRIGMSGKRHSLETREKLRVAFSGERSANWKGGNSPKLTSLFWRIRRSEQARRWRKLVFIAYDFRCEKCGGTDIQAHHKKSFFSIYKNFTNHFSKFSVIEDKEILFELALKYAPFWEVTNGVCLCKKCHTDIHNIYGNPHGKWLRQK